MKVAAGFRHWTASDAAGCTFDSHTLLFVTFKFIHQPVYELYKTHRREFFFIPTGLQKCSTNINNKMFSAHKTPTKQRANLRVANSKGVFARLHNFACLGPELYCTNSLQCHINKTTYGQFTKPVTAHTVCFPNVFTLAL